MAGETDLQTMLQSLAVSVRPDHYAVLTIPTGRPVPRLGDGVCALIHEDEGVTVVATVDRANREEWPQRFVAAWLTLDVHSALEAVGLTAAFSQGLGRAGIPCNVIAGFHHDHILVPQEMRQAAVDAIEALSHATE